mgnify:CR=1 FL=1
MGIVVYGSPSDWNDTRMTKLYTKFGDKGSTFSLGLKEVGKHHCVIHTCGELDELSALIGVMIQSFYDLADRPAFLAHWEDKLYSRRIGDFDKDIVLEFWSGIQTVLLDIGSVVTWLPKEPKLSHPYKAGIWVSIFEEMIDEIDSQCPPLTQFILPSGTPLSAQLHYLRTVVRRAERSMSQSIAELSGMYFTQSIFQCQEVQEGLQFLNRFSDFLFVLARYYNTSLQLGDQEPNRLNREQHPIR